MKKVNKYKCSIKFLNNFKYNKLSKSITISLLLLSLNILYNSKNKDKIIVIIFAGRKKYIEILLKYLQYLKNNKKIDEIHFWQFTNQKDDVEYFNSISNIHKTSRNFLEYKNIYPLIENNTFIIKIKSVSGSGLLLINNMYELIINIGTTTENYLIFNNSNTSYYKKLNYERSEYKFIFKINNNKLLIKVQNRLLISSFINENCFNSIKIKSSNNSDIIWDYEESKNKGYKLFDTTFRIRGHWYEVYKFYLDFEFNILIKLDDDICFIDINRFDDFIKFINRFKKNVTIPNLVNHAVSVFYNNKYGLIPDYILNENYRKKNSSINIFNYFLDGKQAYKVHSYFINNINKFINNNLEPKKLNGERPSICMFGITKESYNKVYNQKFVYKNGIENKDFLFNDEVYTFNLLNNYYYPKFVCIHYSFSPQRKNGLDEMLLEKYNKIANYYLKI